MSVSPVLAGIVPAPSTDTAEVTEGAGLYSNPLGLFGFQAEGVAQSYIWLESEEPVVDCLWETGLGKTHLTLGTAALMLEDGLLDQVIVVAESNKILDWVADFGRFTRIQAQAYRGDPERREKMLADPPPVLVMTYETGRNDICAIKGKGSLAVTGEKMLTTFLKGKRVLIVFDEFTKLRNRGTWLYVAWDYLLNRQLRHAKRNKGGKVMAMGLTATKLEKHPEDFFNANRLLMPWCSPTVVDFEAQYVAAKDDWGNVVAYKNLSPEDCEPGVIPLSRRYVHRALKKRKSDPDVIAEFPAKIENPPRYIDLSEKHRDFYDAVGEIFGLRADDDPAQGNPVYGLLRQLAGHPEALLASQGSMAQEIVRTVGAQALVAMGSAKADALADWAREVGDDQGVIFTFYGQSILPLLARRLRDEKKTVVVNHGKMTQNERQRAQDAFKAGEYQFFLSSDAGARGLNLGCGSVMLHYELPLLYSTFVQRSDRIDRIDSRHGSITVDSLIARDTVEEGIAKTLLDRNAWSDQVLNDDLLVEDQDPGERVLTADLRRRLWVPGNPVTI